MGLKVGSVRLEEYNDNWRKKFLKEKNNLKKIFGEKALSIDHVGSTSIEGMSAKPIIDIAVAVKSLSDFEEFRKKFSKSPYSVKEDSAPGEILVRRGPKSNIGFFIHVMEQNSERYRNTIIFRDYIKSHKRASKKYKKLKTKLAKKYADDRPSYTKAKARFIQSIIKKSSKKKYKKEIILLASACAILSAVFVINGIHDVDTDINTETIETPDILSQEVPILSIQLDENTTLEQIHEGSKEIKYPGNTVTLQNDEQTQVFTDVEIKGRGNTTWSGDKRPYQIKLSEKEDILGMGKAKKWILLANSYDSSNLRNYLAFYIASLVDEEYAPKGKFVQLFINDDYRGLYFLTTKNEIGNERINLKNELGVVAEMELFTDRIDEDEIKFESYNHKTILLSDSVSDDADIAKTAFKHFEDSFKQMEMCIEGAKCSWDTVSSMIDVESFAKYCVISEVTSNVDAYSTSFYFYKDGISDTIHAGPIWDYDLAFGNHWDVSNSSEIFWAGGVSVIIQNLLQYPQFQQTIRSIYNDTILGKASELISVIYAMADFIEDEATENNIMYEKRDFKEAVAYLTDWVNSRIQYLDLVLSKPSVVFAKDEYSLSTTSKLSDGYRLERMDNGNYQIVQISTDQSLCVSSNSSHEELIDVILCEQDEAAIGQSWKIITNDAGGFFIISSKKGLALSYDGQELTVQELSTNSEYQNFKISSFSSL